jgi:hypothetical protein
MVCAPLEFLRKLVALIPPPRKHLTRYHGVFAPNHAWRSEIIPAAPPSAIDLPDAADKGNPPPRVPASDLARRLRWAELMQRVFEEDVTRCPRCGGTTRVLSVILDPDVIERILSHLGLPTEPLDSS